MMSVKYAVCTSFSPDGFRQYGRRFIETFIEHWNIPLVVFHEEDEPNIVHPNITYVDLYSIPEFVAFDKKWCTFAAAHGIVGKEGNKYLVDYHFQALKFARKVFAITDPRFVGDWLLWVDADVITTGPVTDDFLSRACPIDTLLSYLGRDEWPHSECGFVGYRIGHPVGRAFLDELRRIYTSGELFMLDEWHDSYVFDVVRGRFGAWHQHFHNISQNVKGNHVWPNTVLGEVMTHAKGPELKKEIYG